MLAIASDNVSDFGVTDGEELGLELRCVDSSLLRLQFFAKLITLPFKLLNGSFETRKIILKAG